LAALIASSGADVIAAVDNPANVRELDHAAAAFGVRPRIFVELNCGMNRCGIAPGDPAVTLALAVAASPHLRFAGVMAWEGHAPAIADPDARREEIVRAIGELTDTARMCRDAGLPVEIVSCGGSGTYLHTARQPGITEVQAGGATMGDGYYRKLGSPVEPALTLMATVTSRPAEDRVVLDSGRRAVDPSQHAPSPRGLDGVQGIRFSAEHATIALDGPSEWPRIGDRLQLEINYTDQAVHLHETLFGVRDDVIVAAWPVQGRGRIH
jgi:D-serine deaminase-like pyridoxal phosphate-dependent protein